MQSHAEVESAHQEAAKLAAACRARAHEVLANGSRGLKIAGHRRQEYNGAYRAVDERDGWPVLQNEHGMWLYRPAHRGLNSSKSWMLWQDHIPDVDRCNAYFDSPDGSFPMGKQTWRIWDTPSGAFGTGSLTMSIDAE